jgi:hypothetical protein
LGPLGVWVALDDPTVKKSLLLPAHWCAPLRVWSAVPSRPLLRILEQLGIGRAVEAYGHGLI